MMLGCCRLCVCAGEPGAQGAAVAGTHGTGVSTPIAAAVAVSIPPDITCFCEVTLSEHGAVPNEHVIIAPITTCFAIAQFL